MAVSEAGRLAQAIPPLSGERDGECRRGADVLLNKKDLAATIGTARNMVIAPSRTGRGMLIGLTGGRRLCGTSGRRARLTSGAA